MKDLKKKLLNLRMELIDYELDGSTAQAESIKEEIKEVEELIARFE